MAMHLIQGKIFRIALLGSLAIWAQGCAIYWDGLIENKSGTDITVVGNDAKKTQWKIHADEQVDMTWKFNCLEVMEGGKSYYFKVDNKTVPKSALHKSGLSYSVQLLYRDHKLLYVMDGTQTQALDMKSSCASE